MREVAAGEANLDQSYEFAFAAGQLISYLIDRSASKNKTYAMLEPYLQRSTSSQLQSAIVQSIVIYKHDIRVTKGKFENLASQVLSYNGDVDMKPLLRFVLAGCFSPIVIYEKGNQLNDSNNDENNE
jgi:CRISPR-associated protein Csh1